MMDIRETGMGHHMVEDLFCSETINRTVVHLRGKHNLFDFRSGLSPRGVALGGSIFFSTVLLGGCVPNQIEPLEMATPNTFVGAGPAGKASGVSPRWWTAFSDETLTKLEALAEHNPELERAEARVRQARASVDLARSALLPSVSAGVGEARGDKYGFGTSTTKSYGTVSGTWTLDVFGGGQARERASEAELEAAIADRDDIALAVRSSIASAYVNARYYQERIALAQRSIENRKQYVSLLKDGQRAGDISDLQVVQGEHLVAKAESELPSLEVGFENSVNDLASSTGEPLAGLRSDLLSSKGGQPRPKYRVGIGLPAQVIRSRPDVRRAEHAYMAAAENVGVAKAAFYPSLQLSGYLIPTAVVRNGHVDVWQIAADLAAPIFDGGKNDANLAISNAKLAETRAAWRAAVLNGGAEVERALAAYNRDGRNIAAQTKLVSTSQKMVSAGRWSFKYGQDAFINVLDAERDLFEAEKSRAEAIRDRALHYIALCKAAPVSFDLELSSRN